MVWQQTAGDRIELYMYSSAINCYIVVCFKIHALSNMIGIKINSMETG